MHTRGFRNRAVAVAAIGIALSVVGPQTLHAAAQAPLDPNAFASLGSLSGGTTYFFNTGLAPAAPTIIVDNSIVFTGVVINGVAVFDFNSINLSSGSSFTMSAPSVNPLPLALLSRGTAVLNGHMDVGASGTNPGPGGGLGSSSGVGTGPGASTSPGGGAGFGGAGGASGMPGASGGPAYGDPTHVFTGGSGGAGAPILGTTSFVPGGGGGGALEISSLGDISIGGTAGIDDRGADGQSGGSYAGGGGGGSGGGVFIATPGQITISSDILVNGGSGGDSTSANGGGGAGGRILLETSNFLELNAGFATGVGGTAGHGTGIAGTPGQAATTDVTAYVAAVPEPGIGLVLLICAPLLTRRKTTAHPQ